MAKNFSVYNILPHREPFLFVDHLEKVDVEHLTELINYSMKDLEGASVEASFTFPINHIFNFDGVVPRVLGIEMMAQGACLVLNSLESAYGSSLLKVALLAVDHIEFFGDLKAGTKLTIKAVCKRIRGSIVFFSGEIMDGDQTLLSGNFTATYSLEDNSKHAPQNAEDLRFD